MTVHRVTYTLDGKQHYRTIDYASNDCEAAKMVELGAKWNNPKAQIDIVSVESIDENFSKAFKNRASDSLKNSYLFKYIEEE